MQDHHLQPERDVNPWYPFDGPGEWSLAKFLVENLLQTQIEQFLKLEWFKMRERPQFKSKDELFYYLEQLPGCGPKWQCTEFCLKGYKTEQPIHLIWRDGLEVVKQLLSNPVYANHMCYDPHRMHLLFMTIGNIQSDVRMKATSHAWRCVVFMPTPKFIVNLDYQTLLQTCLWHKCVDLVCLKLKIAACVGEFMVNASANRCFCFTPLISHITDLPEQLMIACVSKNLSPVTTATQKEFGDAIPHPPCNGVDTYELICKLYDRVDPWDLYNFLKEAKKLHLSGWVKEAMGHKLDLQFWSQHKHVGVHHFTSGVSHVKQMTGREHRDIQRTVVPTMWGTVIRAMIDFIYLAQNPVHTEASLKAMSTALSDFHDHKQTILNAEARRGKGGAKDNFFIPKLELMQSFTHMIPHKTSRQKDFETIHLFKLYTLLASSPVSASGRASNDPLVNVVSMEDDEVTGPEVDPVLAWISRVNPDAQRCLHAPHPVRNHFLKGIMSDDARIAFNVTINPDFKCLTVLKLQTLYNIVDFLQALHHYFTIHNHGDLNMQSSQVLFSAWFKFHIQLYSAFHECTIMPSQLLQAKPPSSKFSYGHCNTVLIQNNRSSVPYVAQVQAVFQLTTLPIKAPALNQVLAYVQHFNVIGDKPEPTTGMWRLTCSYLGDVLQPQSRRRCGSILPLTDITHGVELIPVYNTLLPKEVDSSNSLEVFDEYFLNNFADKELYHTLAVAFGV
ncbi:hypothetical protein BDR03DRAFT_935693 [Suillus americanus]|nr:hypothetical protein BDR03DRAFT_935693 [Suillus americanus]